MWWLDRRDFDRPQFRIADALRLFPEIRERLAGASPVTAEMGSVTGLRRVRSVVCGRVVLIGDAAGTVDGIAGQGLSLAFQQALALGEALAKDDLAQYKAAHRQGTRAAERMASLLLLMDRSEWLRRRTLKLFQDRPAIFAKLISGHTEARRPELLKS